MNRFLENLLNRLNSLYNVYERYMWHNNDSRLDVLVQDGAISFYFYKGEKVLDEFVLSFDNKEYKLYKYIGVRLMIILLGNVHIYKDNNILYNNTHKSYLKFIVNDESVLDVISEIIKKQGDEIIGIDMDTVKKMESNIPKRNYSNNFMNVLDKWIDFSKLVLRRC